MIKYYCNFSLSEANATRFTLKAPYFLYLNHFIIVTTPTTTVITSSSPSSQHHHLILITIINSLIPSPQQTLSIYRAPTCLHGFVSRELTIFEITAPWLAIIIYCMHNIYCTESFTYLILSTSPLELENKPSTTSKKKIYNQTFQMCCLALDHHSIWPPWQGFLSPSTELDEWT